jgi:hypothetical protein
MEMSENRRNLLSVFARSENIALSANFNSNFVLLMTSN